MEVVKPNLKNFVKSLRDIGYTFEIAIADILDNSISANASKIKIFTVAEPELVFAILDDGIGMSTEELVNAMRLATKNPENERAKDDLGRFGLGLKTASFSQCKKLTVISKKNNKLSARQWDLDFIAETDEWYLLKPENECLKSLPLFDELCDQEHGTLVIWQYIDGLKNNNFSDKITKLRQHLSLVFHRFIEGTDMFRSVSIEVNNNPIKAFNPFNSNHPATQQLAVEKIKLHDSTINIQPYILPHHSKLSQQEYERYATEDGYTRSQGFYLYRANRLLIYGTWWGLHKAIDAHKLVRIKIDIPNEQDSLWGIDLKKSTANPSMEIKNDLKRIINRITEKGSRPYTGRGRKIDDKSTTMFWKLVPINDEFRFEINEEHPLFKKLLFELPNETRELFNVYLKGIQAYLPLDSIQAHLQQNPHKVVQETVLSREEIDKIVEQLKLSGLDRNSIDELLKTEIFKNYREAFVNDAK
ncbi:ATP-binding protein [Serpentinicella alkaliphila]|uniref:Histidine kinase/DNA gyrase B/HSP90-like ATPase n=1 Tax=Serpentinicella alkaliphila TaxID=1734049 RepID=A0A4R2T6T8_9FIRM|nr:ATP-binding protein [Serpentinicella alkaliphila]QUH26418.1 ATP-binding protein [Serpentinicella alkaliphila]TCP97845.1 histidine kinase/DNA gyrase B/HSP90-like ATPase [Serpentinicella alkaliphila]